jgi:hypothetical protein
MMRSSLFMCFFVVGMAWWGILTQEPSCLAEKAFRLAQRLHIVSYYFSQSFRSTMNTVICNNNKIL